MFSIVLIRFFNVFTCFSMLCTWFYNDFYLNKRNYSMFLLKIQAKYFWKRGACASFSVLFAWILSHFIEEFLLFNNNFYMFNTKFQLFNSKILLNKGKLPLFNSKILLNTTKFYYKHYKSYLKHLTKQVYNTCFTSVSSTICTWSIVNLLWTKGFTLCS